MRTTLPTVIGAAAVLGTWLALVWLQNGDEPDLADPALALLVPLAAGALLAGFDASGRSLAIALGSAAATILVASTVLFVIQDAGPLEYLVVPLALVAIPGGMGLGWLPIGGGRRWLEAHRRAQRLEQQRRDWQAQAGGERASGPERRAAHPGRGRAGRP